MVSSVVKSASSRVAKRLAGFLAGSLLVLPALAQSDKAGEPPPAAPASSPTKVALAAPSSARTSSPYRPTKLAEHAKSRYVAAWGVDKMKVSYTASGNLIRFSYRVVDPARAQAINEKSSTPYLLGQRSHAVLKIPVMDKVGQLRQSGTPQAGQEYWMVFSNKGNLIKRGDRVNVMIGSFHADGLVVE